MRKTYKYRIYLTSGQKRILKTQLEECRWVYNQLLEAREFAYEQRLKCNRYDLINMLPSLKEQRPSLKLVLSQVLQNIAIRLDLAFQAFFRRVKEGSDDPGYPRYKKFDRYRSITYYYSWTCLEISDWEAEELSNTLASPPLPEAKFL